MGLELHEERSLAQIERALRGSDPTLAAALGNFNRLSARQAMPAGERLLGRPSRAVRFAPMAMAAIVLSMILIAATVLSRLGPASPENASTACGIAWVKGCGTSSAPSGTQTAKATGKVAAHH